MSWFDNFWKYRTPITIVNSGGAGTIDISAPMQKDFDLFWINVLSTGFDIRITEADGITPITFAQGNCTGWDFGPAAFDKTNRVFTLRIDGWTGALPTVDAALQIWLYWGNGGAADARDGAVALVGALTGYYETRSLKQFPRRLVTGLETPGSLTPSRKFQKPTTDITEVAWDFSKELAKREAKNQGRLQLEEIRAVEVDGGQGTTSVASVRTRSMTRFVRENVVVTRHEAGTDGQNYWLEAKATTSLGNKLTRRIEMRARNTIQS